MGKTVLTVIVSTVVSGFTGALVASIIAWIKIKIKQPADFKEHTEQQFKEIDKKIDSLVELFNQQLEQKFVEYKTDIMKQFQVTNKNYEYISDAILCGTRKNLIHECEKYLSYGKITIYARDSIQKMYRAYHNLGGNGTITDLYNRVMKLPIIEED